MDMMSFQEAMAIAQDEPGKIHLLVGNGFSIALRPDIFTYTSLFSEADFDQFPAVKKVFEQLRTTDFEDVVWGLEKAAAILPCYNNEDTETPRQMTNDAIRIKEVLIKTIAGKHPARPFEISDEQYAHCIRFLKYFLDTGGKIYTLNYDILLYWALMKGKNADLGDEYKLDFDDAFRNDQDDPDTPYVVWDNGNTHSQNVFYIHGALHLFDAGHELRKYTWKRTDVALVDQARDAIHQGLFPLFVSEGTSQAKMSKIAHNGYLNKSLRSLKANPGTLFIHGMSLSKNDEHILRAIEKGKFKKVFIGIHGNPDTAQNQAIATRAEILIHNNDRLEVNFYDSTSAKVWGTA